MRKFSASVILVMMMVIVALYGSAHADVFYLTDSGVLGRISVYGWDSADIYGTQYTTSWSSPFLGSYWNGSTTRVILVDRTTDTTTSGDTALVFNPSDLTQPESTSKVLAGVYYAQAMAGSDNGRSVFFASGSSIHEFSTGDFSLRRSYTYRPNTSDDIVSEITGLITDSNVIYALVQQDISRDMVLGFDGQLREDVSSFERRYLAEEAAAISWLNGARVAAAHEYGVDVWYDNRGFVHLLSSDFPVKAVCQDSGSGLYFIEQYESEGTYTTTLNHYTTAGGVKELFTNTEGQICRLVRDGDNGILAAIVGDELLVYMMENDAVLGEYDSSELGGLPDQITVSAVSGEKSKSNSGCSITGAGMMVLLLAGVSAVRKRH